MAEVIVTVTKIHRKTRTSLVTNSGAKWVPKMEILDTELYPCN